jgi:hypothetical protein
MAFDPEEDQDDVAGQLPGNTAPDVVPSDPDALATPSFGDYGTPPAAPPAPDSLATPAFAAPGIAPPPANPVQFQQPSATPSDPAADLIKRQGLVDMASAKAKQDQADAEAKQAADHQKAVDEATAHGNQVYADAQKKYDDAVNKYQGQHLKDYWDDDSHSRFQAGISVALGGLGASIRAAGGGSSHNDAVDILQKKIADWNDKQKFEIEKMRDTVAMARTGLGDAREAKASLITDVNAKQSATLGSIEAQVRQRLAAQGVPAAQIEQDSRIQQLQMARAQAARTQQEQSIKDAKTAAETKYIDARTRKVGASGGSKGATLAEAKVAKAIEDGQTPSQVRELGANLGIKPQRLDALETQGRAAAKTGGADSVDPKLLVRDSAGKPIGTAGTPRAVPQIQKDLRANARAIEQLKIARDYVDGTHIPLKSDPRFHNAVLSVAATTNANQSDATTKHEEGTLTNILGRPDTDAIDRKIDELTATGDALRNQVNPLPDGWEEKTAAKASPAPANSNGAKAPANDNGVNDANAWVLKNAKDPLAKGVIQKLKADGTLENSPRMKALVKTLGL